MKSLISILIIVFTASGCQSEEQQSKPALIERSFMVFSHEEADAIILEDDLEEKSVKNNIRNFHAAKGKVLICHFPAGKNEGMILSINVNGLNGHLRTHELSTKKSLKSKKESRSHQNHDYVLSTNNALQPRDICHKSDFVEDMGMNVDIDEDMGMNVDIDEDMSKDKEPRDRDEIYDPID